MWWTQREKARFRDRKLKNSTVPPEPLLGTAQVSQWDDVATAQPHRDTWCKITFNPGHFAGKIGGQTLGHWILFCSIRWKIHGRVPGCQFEPEADVLLRGHAESPRLDARSTRFHLQVLRQPDCQVRRALASAEGDEEGDEQGAQQGPAWPRRLQHQRTAVLEVIIDDDEDEDDSYYLWAYRNQLVMQSCSCCSTPEPIPRMMSSVSLQKQDSDTSSIRGEYVWYHIDRK